MKIRKIMGLIVAVSLLLISSCSGPMPSPSPSLTPDEFSLSMVEINQDAVSAEVKEYTSPKKKIVISPNDPVYREILGLLNSADIKKITAKSQVMTQNGQPTAVSVSIPYTLGRMLTFQMKDGTHVEFDCLTAEIWFETEKTIYQLSVGPELYPLLGNLLKQ